MKQIKLTESQYCECFDEISGDKFIDAMKIAHDAALSHSGYQHYMSLMAFEKIIQSRSFWLSRLDNQLLNDWNESGKYGSPYGWRRTYIGCFSYGRSESAAMWKMYCHPSKNVIRVFISQKGFMAWNERLKDVKKLKVYPVYEEGKGYKRGNRCVQVRTAGLTDVLYVSMNGNDERYDDSGCVFWNGRYVRIEDLRECVSCRGVEGFVKDLPWQYERETRLFVILKNAQCASKRLSIPVPDEVFKSMSFVLSPWLPVGSIDAMKEKIEDLFEGEGFPKPNMIRPSQLMGALGGCAWKH